MNIEAVLDELEASGNLRRLPAESPAGVIDLSSNDYLGLGEDIALRESFFASHDSKSLLMTSSASRLLAGRQTTYSILEKELADSYGHNREALLFNSGYHANTGLVSAIADKNTLILADRLVHASIIDGIKLSGAPFARFAHNDFGHLRKLLESKGRDYSNVLIIVESVYSMDGDRADIGQLTEIKKSHPGSMLYVDEAHAVGVLGPGGLGECAAAGVLDQIDILVGTFGKALASMGAYAIMSPTLKQFMINKARSLIFSTALPPAQIDWSLHVWRHATSADSARQQLMLLASQLARIIPGGEPSHIRPLIVGSSEKALAASAKLLEGGYKVLPIRTPTVPPGTERLRFSLSAAIASKSLAGLSSLINSLS